MDKQQIAKLAHEANRAYCQMIGDNSVLPWEDSSEQHRAMILKGVESIENNPSMSPEQGHQKWLEARKADGWKYGPEKNLERKEHPCMVPYGSLPLTQRFKDYLFHSVVAAALTME